MGIPLGKYLRQKGLVFCVDECRPLEVNVAVSSSFGLRVQPTLLKLLDPGPTNRPERMKVISWFVLDTVIFA